MAGEKNECWRGELRPAETKRDATVELLEVAMAVPGSLWEQHWKIPNGMTKICPQRTTTVTGGEISLSDCGGSSSRGNIFTVPAGAGTTGMSYALSDLSSLRNLIGCVLPSEPKSSRPS